MSLTTSDMDNIQSAIRAGASGFAPKPAEAMTLHEARELAFGSTDPGALYATEGYEPLFHALKAAYDQSAFGKGKQRHANGKPFDHQPIMEIARMVGVGGQTFQICKKAQEATSMAARGDLAAAKAEILGVIVYAAAAWNLLSEQEASK